MMDNVKKAYKKPSEKKMVQAVLNLFRQQGINSLFTEVQFCERYIDIMCFDDRNHTFFAVEAKVNATSKAFRQAGRYKYIADYVYVAILKNGSNKTALELSRDTGIGLIFVKRDSLDRYYAEIAIPSKISIYKNEIIANYVWNIKAENRRPT